MDGMLHSWLSTDNTSGGGTYIASSESLVSSSFILESKEASVMQTATYADSKLERHLLYPKP